ncbi:MAG: hypothetical protein H7Z38_12395, partial [Rubrivivax sp.]|nr:hypothetical protein [Pyrinomonadaceae bacterium]
MRRRTLLRRGRLLARRVLRLFFTAVGVDALVGCAAALVGVPALEGLLLAPSTAARRRTASASALA